MVVVVVLEGEESVLGCNRPGDCVAVGLDPVDGFSVLGKKIVFSWVFRPVLVNEGHCSPSLPVGIV